MWARGSLVVALVGALVARGTGFTPATTAGDAEAPEVEPELEEEAPRADGCLGVERAVGSATTFFAQRDLVRAKETYDDVLAAAPDCVEALVGSGRLTAYFGDLEGAEAKYQRALEMEPRNPDAHMAMGKVHSFQMRWDEALESYEACLALVEGNSPLRLEVLTLLVRVYCWMGDSLAALEKADEVLALAPGQANEPFLNFDMAISHLTSRDSEGAHAYMSRAMAGIHAAIAAGPGPPAMPDLSVIGDVLLLQQRYDLAARAFRWTLELSDYTLMPELVDDGVADAYFAVRVHLTLGLAQAREMLGDEEAAKDAYGEILEMVDVVERSQRECPVTKVVAAKGAARLGLLRLGLGLRNQGAVTACGMPDEVVAEIRNLAETMEEWIGVRQAGQDQQDFRDAVEFCDTERVQAEVWRLRRKRVVPDSLVGRLRTKAGRVARGLVQRVGRKVGRRGKTPATQGGPETLGEALRRVATPVEVIPYEDRDDERLKRDLRQCLLGDQPFVFRSVPDGGGRATQAVREKIAAVAAGGASAPGADDLVVASLSPTARFDGPLDGRALGLEVDEILMRPAVESLYMQDLLALLKHQTACEQHGDICVLPHMYVEYLALHQYPLQFVQGLEVPDAGDHVLSNVWMGGSSTLSPLHYDDWGNLLEQVYGTKEVLIFPPSTLAGLAYHPRHRSKYAYEFPNSFNVSAFDRNTVVIFGSSLQLDAPASAENTVTEDIALQAQTATLGPGDVLCMPAFWHHEVRSTPETVVDGLQLNVAVNHWYETESVFEEEAEVFG